MKNEEAAIALRDAFMHLGSEIADGRRLRNYLKDQLPNDEGAVHLLMTAHQFGVLRVFGNVDRSDKAQIQLLANRFIQHDLVGRAHVAPPAACWAVESWLIALGVVKQVVINNKKSVSQKPPPKPQALPTKPSPRPNPASQSSSQTAATGSLVTAKQAGIAVACLVALIGAVVWYNEGRSVEPSREESAMDALRRVRSSLEAQRQAAANNSAEQATEPGASVDLSAAPQSDTSDADPFSGSEEVDDQDPFGAAPEESDDSLDPFGTTAPNSAPGSSGDPRTFGVPPPVIAATVEGDGATTDRQARSVTPVPMPIRSSLEGTLSNDNPFLDLPEDEEPPGPDPFAGVDPQPNDSPRGDEPAGLETPQQEYAKILERMLRVNEELASFGAEIDAREWETIDRYGSGVPTLVSHLADIEQNYMHRHGTSSFVRGFIPEKFNAITEAAKVIDRLRDAAENAHPAGDTSLARWINDRVPKSQNASTVEVLRSQVQAEVFRREKAAAGDVDPEFPRDRDLRRAQFNASRVATENRQWAIAAEQLKGRPATTAASNPGDRRQ